MTYQNPFSTLCATLENRDRLTVLLLFLFKPKSDGYSADEIVTITNKSYHWVTGCLHRMCAQSILRQDYKQKKKVYFISLNENIVKQLLITIKNNIRNEMLFKLLSAFSSKELCTVTCSLYMHNFDSYSLLSNSSEVPRTSVIRHIKRLTELGIVDKRTHQLTVEVPPAFNMTPDMPITTRFLSMATQAARAHDGRSVKWWHKMDYGNGFYAP